MASFLTGIALLTIILGCIVFLGDAALAVREARHRASMAWRRGRRRRPSVLVGGGLVLLGVALAVLAELLRH